MLKHNPNWKVPANENLYVFYGRFWRGFGDATKGIVHHDNVANLMKDSMVGDLVPVIAKTVSRKRHFIYL
jgi:hypothetical protein